MFLAVAMEAFQAFHRSTTTGLFASLPWLTLAICIVSPLIAAWEGVGVLTLVHRDDQHGPGNPRRPRSALRVPARDMMVRGCGGIVPSFSPAATRVSTPYPLRALHIADSRANRAARLLLVTRPVHLTQENRSMNPEDMLWNAPNSSTRQPKAGVRLW